VRDPLVGDRLTRHADQRLDPGGHHK
jgi:hypothetical protein